MGSDERHVLRVVSSMDDEAVGRAVGQFYYDIALREPSVTVGLAGEIGGRVRRLMVSHDGDWTAGWGPIASRYLSESLVTSNPQAAAVALCRLAAAMDYCLSVER